MKRSERAALREWEVKVVLVEVSLIRVDDILERSRGRRIRRRSEGRRRRRRRKRLSLGSEG